MGFFSWITSDTQRSIPNIHSPKRESFPVHMITEDGRVFSEPEYDGYGVFGGKDFYVLAAELNGVKGATDDKTRSMFFSLIWNRGVRKGDVVLYYGKDFSNYGAAITVEGIEGEVTPNDLVANHGWESWSVSHSGDTQDFVDAGFKMPKIVEELDTTIPRGDNEQWKRYWDSLPYPESCPDQGYFYWNDEEDECPNCGNELDAGTCYHCDSDDE